ncbi:hypothetical protein ACWDOR_37095 [Streptosporangium canum]|uniref:hypothetical protein n=1 Tax=Streptosporangium canum TaxID=324952 RepID=UPI00378D7EAD
MSSDLDELDYLRRVELLARDLVERAFGEGMLSCSPDPDDANPLHRAIDELARTLRHYHFDGDGCVDDRPLYRIAGAGLIRPDSDSYAELCVRLGVQARAEGWALWHTWDNRHQPHTLVTTCIATTEGLLENWARGISVLPAKPDRSQLVAVVREWAGPVVLSPDHAREIGIAGQ